MSEAERRKRQDYKQNRLKWIIIQISIISVIAIIALVSFIVYDRMNRTYYIHYTEQGDVDYKVHYKENEFFEDEWLGEDQAYISTLIDNVLADFKYDLAMGAESVGFDYSYSIVASLRVTDKTTGDPLFAPKYELVPEKSVAVTGNRIRIREQVAIDYVKYNELAKHFVNTYSLKNATSMLAVVLKVDVLGRCDDFAENSKNSYFVSLDVPLNTETLDVNLSSTVDETEDKVIACSNAQNKNVFLIIGIVALVLALLGGGGLVAFMYLTRNEDINYSIKVKKIVNAYRSFIQQMDGEFDTEGYQEIYIKTFVELLGIRDTIQSPVLMSENEDKTCTKFLVPTSNKLLYIYELKVENYDDIYNLHSSVAELPVEETVILDPNTNMDDVAEAISSPDVNLDEIEFVMDDDDDFAAAEDEPGIEVVGVVWPERAHRNKVYRYDPNGEQLEEGDVVLVPTRDVARQRDVIRKAAVAHPNHRVEPEHIKHPLKKIIGVVKRRFESALTPESKE